MSRAPCGHLDAECVIGNFWTCKSCGGESIKPKADLVEQFIGPVRAEYSLPAGKQARIDQLAVPNTPAVDWPVDWPVKLNDAVVLQTALRIVTKDVLDRSRDLIAPGIERIEDAYGDRTVFIDPWTGERSQCHRSKLWCGVALNKKSLMHDPKAAMIHLEHAVGKFIELANAKIQTIVEHRGWTNYRLGTLGELPHALEEDGNIALGRVDAWDQLEIRIRGFFTVVPK